MSNADNLASIITRVTEPYNPRQVVASLNAMAKRDEGEAHLKGSLPGGEDPLQILNVQTATLPWLFILYASTCFRSGYAESIHANLTLCHIAGRRA